MATKLAETMNETVIIYIHKPFIFFVKTVFALSQ